MPALKEKVIQGDQGRDKDGDSPILPLSKQLEESKRTLLDYLESHYEKFVPAFETASQLSNRINHLLHEVDQVSSTIGDMLSQEVDSGSTAKKELSERIAALQLEAEVVEKLLQIDSILNQLEKMSAKDPGEFENFSKLISEGENLLSSLSNIQELEIMPVLESGLSKVKSDLISALLHMWHDRVTWQVYDAENEVTLTMHEVRDLPKLSNVLESVGEFSLLVRQFSRKLFESVLKHIPEKSCEIVQKKIGDDVTLRMCKVEASRPTFEKATSNLLTVLQTLYDAFGHPTVELIGNFWKTQLCELLIEKCIAPAVPSSAEDLELFDVYISQTNSLQESLQQLGFLSAEDQMLSQYVQNVNFLYANKLCQEVLVSARALIAKELHDTIRRGPEDVGLVASTYQSKTSEEWQVLASIGIDVNESPFLFPECTISKSTLEILDLMKSTLCEAERNGPEIRARLHHACRSIISLYISTMPIVHKSVLANLPQHCALAHNNCMYLGHVLLTIKVGSVPFVTQAQNLRQLGAQIFLAQMRIQKSHLLTMLNDGGLNSLGSESSMGTTLEKAFRQCVLHLKHLQQVWQSVLPDTVYCRAIGTLTNSVLEEITNKIAAVEDIPADVAVSLVAHGSYITDALPSLFKTREDSDAETQAKMRRHVSRYEQFSELLKLLNASLKDIEDRWANGSGPLALYFTADQVKHMIRALFQNTEMRAALLTKIK